MGFSVTATFHTVLALAESRGGARGVVMRVQCSRSCHLERAPDGDQLETGGTWGQQLADLMWQMQDSGWKSEAGQYPAVSEQLRDECGPCGGL